MAILKRLAVLTTALGGLLGAAALSAALAVEPYDWQIGFQKPVSPTMVKIDALNDLLFVIITLTVVFVMGLLCYVMWRFSEKRNPTPSRTTHHTLVEVLWTVAPVVILVIIAVPSFQLLYYGDRVEQADMTIKAIGRQWYWSYEYPDHGNFTFDSYMVPDDELAEGQPRLLATDTAVVLPVDTKIRVLITASDVLHAFAMPAMGLKLDAVPGRINETWVEITEEGIFYGQCSEICGTGHSYMPIMIKAVSKAAFEDWAAQAQKEFAGLDSPPRPEQSATAAPPPMRLAEAASERGDIEGDD